MGGRTDLKTCDDNVFYAEASLGTPPQTFQLLIDTGSSDLWVAATNCEDVQGGNGGCPTTNLYDFEASSTAKGFEGVRVAIDYVDGELARGPALSDTFTFGGVAVQNMEFVAADQADFWACGQEDGVLGAVVAGLEYDTGGRRGRTPPGGCAEPDGGRSREGVLRREPGRVERFKEISIAC